MKLVVADNFSGQLTAGINASSTSIAYSVISGDIDEFDGVNAQYPTIVTLRKYTTAGDRTTPILATEHVLVIAITSTLITVATGGRGYGNSTATSFAVDDWVEINFNKDMFDGLQAEIASTKNIVLNSGFRDLEGSNNVVNPAEGAEVLSNWLVGRSADGGTLPTTITHSQQISSGQSWYRVAWNGAGSSLGNASYNYIRYGIPLGVRKLSGANKKLTLKFEALSDLTSKKVGAYLLLDYGSGGSPTADEVIVGDAFTCTTSAQEFTVTFDMNTLSGKTFGTNDDDILYVVLTHQWGATNDAYVGETTAEGYIGAGHVQYSRIQLVDGMYAGQYREETPSAQTAQRWEFFATLSAANQSMFVQDAIQYFTVPEGMDGYSLSEILSYEVRTAGTTGTTNVQIYNRTQAVNMLSTVASIDSGETSFTTAATPPVINDSNNTVSAGDMIDINVAQVSSVPPQGGSIRLLFTL